MTSTCDTSASSVRPSVAGAARLALFAGLCVSILGSMVGCEVDSYIEPSRVGRWEVTPTSVPILERLVAIEGPAGQASVETTPVRPEDLIPDVAAYQLGPGDGLELRIQDLFRPDVEETLTRDVDSRGFIDLPRIGRLMVDGLTEDDVKEVIGQALLDRQIILRQPDVSVSVTRPRKQTFNILGGVNSPGLYGIPRPDFRLLEALTGAGRFTESAQSVYVIRHIPLMEKVTRGTGPRPEAAPRPGPANPLPGGAPDGATKPPPKDLIDLIDELSRPKEQPKDNPGIMPAVLGGGASRFQPPPGQPKEPPVDLPDDPPRAPAGQSPPVVPDPGGPAPGAPPASPPGDQPAAPVTQAAAPAPDAGAEQPPERFWVFRDGKWVQVTKVRRVPGAAPIRMAPDAPMLPDGQPVPATEAAPQPPTVKGAEKLVTQRVIEVPLAPLLAGSAQFNIVIRPGDVIRLPVQAEGVVYVNGEVNRPGVFTLPASGRLTLRRVVVAAGGLSNLAIPQRVDLTRMVGTDRQATIRIDLAAIEEGTMPDIFLKADDVVNVGTNFWAFPLAVIRQGFRASYGFGFVLDRNFDEELFGPRQGLR